jgi:site-specific DNA-cytosine methylase
MVFSMLEAVKGKRYKAISEALGTESWQKELDDYLSRGETHELFRKIFLEQLNKLGYKTTDYLVTSTDKNAPQYYLIFCACNDKIYAIHKNIEPNIKRLQNTDWVKETAIISYQIRKVPVAQKNLLSY